MKKCPHCAAELTDQATWCQFCSKSLSTPGSSGATKAIAGLVTFFAVVGCCFLFCVPKDEPAPAVAARPEPEPPHDPGVVREYACSVVAARFIRKMWQCGLNAEGFTEEKLCASISTSKLRYMAGLETCTEFLVRSGIAK